MIQQVQEVARTAHEILIINEMMKKIEEEKLEPWSPVNIVIDAMGKDIVQKALLQHLGILKQELKENITLLD